MPTWFDYEVPCEVCGRAVTQHVKTTGAAMYCSRACRRLEQLLRMTTRKYGITPAVFRRMLSDQQGKCAICLRELGDFSYSENLMQIDHDHASGKVRGLLCGRCNRGLGAFRDDPTVLEAAAAYLRAQASTSKI